MMGLFPAFLNGQISLPFQVPLSELSSAIFSHITMPVRTLYASKCYLNHVLRPKSPNRSTAIAQNDISNENKTYTIFKIELKLFLRPRSRTLPRWRKRLHSALVVADIVAQSIHVVLNILSPWPKHDHTFTL